MIMYSWNLMRGHPHLYYKSGSTCTVTNSLFFQFSNFTFRIHNNFLRREKPDVVFLQEVVQATEALLEKHCTDYMLVPGRRYEADEYYTAVMLKMSTAQYQSRQIVPFTSSLMMRNLLMVKVGQRSVGEIHQVVHFTIFQTPGPTCTKHLNLRCSLSLNCLEDLE